jgi:uncharacterized protein DUF6510
MSEDAMDDEIDMAAAMTLDGNAVAGMFQELFGADMTAAPSQCGHCGNHAEVGSMRAYTQGPGVVLRCSICRGVIVRLVRTPAGTFLDARGAAWIRLASGEG